MTNNNPHRKCIIFSAPSGSGKTTLVKYMMEKSLPLSFSISATSRSARKNEIHTQDYYFLSSKDFNEKINNNEFIEWEEVYKGVHYGTLKSELERIFLLGKVPVFDVDVLGGIALKKILGKQALSVFVQVSNIQELEKRLISRDTDSLESINKRLEKAEYEMSFAPQFDHIIINDDLKTAVEETYQTIQKFIDEK